MTRLSAEARHVLMARLLEQRRTAGLVAEDVRRTARQVGIAERTLWRWLAGALPRTHARSSYELTDTDTTLSQGAGSSSRDPTSNRQDRGCPSRPGRRRRSQCAGVFS